MKDLSLPRRWGFCVLAALLLAACNANSLPPSVPTQTTPAPTALPAQTQEAEPPAFEGGSAPVDAELEAAAPVTAAPASATVDVPAATLPAATAVAPAVAPTATRQPAPTAAPTAAPQPAPTAAPTPVLQPAPAEAVAPQPVPALPAPTSTATRTFSTRPNPLQIEVMRQQSYPGSEITVEQKLAPGANYSRYIVSYRSEGLKIYALMTVPNGPKPASGWPAIVFNHGYIPPAQYRTTERYVAYVDAIARAGYIVFKSDYRGHGSSEGSFGAGGYGSPAYTVDVLNAVASLKAYPDADPARIGMWGHSMGGQLTLRAMVISKDIKAGVIWGGVVAPYPDMLTHWTRRAPAPYVPPSARHWRQDLINEYGTPQQNPAFWASISPNSYLQDLSGPLELHASVTDEEVPVAFSQTLNEELKAANSQPFQLYTYPGDNHNISGNFNTAMARTIAWFNKYVKGQ